MIKCAKCVSVVLSLALFAGSAIALADPGNGKGQGNNKGHNQAGQGHGKPDGKGSAGNHGPSVDRGSVLSLVGGSRDYWSPRPALPPGIQKNLARGKPLPPGIAKKLDGRLAGRLPHYDGYEWQQAGTDLILVAIATGIIYEVLNGAFD
ncbi:anti-virulence regulator CigR family protein [Pseudomonas sp. R3-52-08]|uniref:anti-virulence regulator CigR family protein n=1 Tax=Pseudomonas sp. R3-52-08 TaxID=1173284 RepID=UPI000F583D57|nr:anti-virulence regulator CigR family protein [Pseudomonas sp. R3-52-08]AZF22369.1 CigR (Putative inner membrane protein) [Pseudomonas sp. R3-52-08]